MNVCFNNLTTDHVTMIFNWLQCPHNKIQMIGSAYASIWFFVALFLESWVDMKIIIWYYFWVISPPSSNQIRRCIMMLYINLFCHLLDILDIRNYFA